LWAISEIQNSKAKMTGGRRDDWKEEKKASRMWDRRKAVAAKKLKGLRRPSEHAHKVACYCITAACKPSLTADCMFKLTFDGRDRGCAGELHRLARKKKKTKKEIAALLAAPEARTHGSQPFTSFPEGKRACTA
jgi:hypothetical protein